jgi:hypothetical protein
MREIERVAEIPLGRAAAESTGGADRKVAAPVLDPPDHSANAGERECVAFAEFTKVLSPCCQRPDLKVAFGLVGVRYTTTLGAVPLSRFVELLDRDWAARMGRGRAELTDRLGDREEAREWGARAVALMASEEEAGFTGATRRQRDKGEIDQFGDLETLADHRGGILELRLDRQRLAAAKGEDIRATLANRDLKIDLPAITQEAGGEQIAEITLRTTSDRTSDRTDPWLGDPHRQLLLLRWFIRPPLDLAQGAAKAAHAACHRRGYAQGQGRGNPCAILAVQGMIAGSVTVQGGSNR